MTEKQQSRRPDGWVATDGDNDFFTHKEETAERFRQAGLHTSPLFFEQGDDVIARIQASLDAAHDFRIQIKELISKGFSFGSNITDDLFLMRVTEILKWIEMLKDNNRKAAAEIEALKAELESLRAAEEKTP